MAFGRFPVGPFEPRSPCMLETAGRRARQRESNDFRQEIGFETNFAVNEAVWSVACVIDKGTSYVPENMAGKSRAPCTTRTISRVLGSKATM